MPRQRREPEPPKQTIWADKTKAILEDVRKQRQELVTQLDAKERAAKELCNHTFLNGTSAIEVYYDSEDDRHHARCSVCQT